MKKREAAPHPSSRFLRRALPVLLTTGALSASAREALAKGETVAVYVEGAEARPVRATLVGVVGQSATVDDADGFGRALLAQGQRAPVGKALDGRARATVLRRLRGAASARGVDAVLVARVVRGARKHIVRLLLVESSGAESDLGSVSLDLKGDGRDDAEVASVVGAALEPHEGGAAGTTPAPAEKTVNAAQEPTPEAVAASGQERDEARGSRSGRPRGLEARSLFAVEIGADASSRHFAYHDGVSDNLRSYDVDLTPMFTANAELFPLADAGGVLRDVGFIAGYSRSVFLQSAASGGPTLNAVESSYYAGLRVRIHPGGDQGWVLGISDAFADQAFDFNSTGGTLDTQVPTVDYRSNRTALDARIPLGRLAILAGAGFRVVLDAGNVSERFRSSSVEGLDGQVGLAFSIASEWEVRLIGDYERYFYAFKPVPGDAYVAGGALDQFYGARLALAYVF